MLCTLQCVVAIALLAPASQGPKVDASHHFLVRHAFGIRLLVRERGTRSSLAAAGYVAVLANTCVDNTDAASHGTGSSYLGSPGAQHPAAALWVHLRKHCALMRRTRCRLFMHQLQGPHACIRLGWHLGWTLTQCSRLRSSHCHPTHEPCPQPEPPDY
jgi:hypothetical protein